MTTNVLDKSINDHVSPSEGHRSIDILVI
jgi:hypothetical protein